MLFEATNQVRFVAHLCEASFSGLYLELWYGQIGVADHSDSHVAKYEGSKALVWRDGRFYAVNKRRRIFYSTFRSTDETDKGNAIWRRYSRTK